jgi:hypothetical protein
MIAIDWTGLTGNSISAALGGGIALLGVYLTNRRSEQARHVETLRARGEELYALNADFIKGLSSYFMRRIAVMCGNLTYNQLLDQEIEALKGKHYDLGRIEMLIDVYFSKARPAFDRLLQAREAMSEIALEHKQDYKSGDLNGARFIARFEKAMDKVDAAGKSLGEIVVNALRSL